MASSFARDWLAGSRLCFDDLLLQWLASSIHASSHNQLSRDVWSDSTSAEIAKTCKANGLLPSRFFVRLCGIFLVNSDNHHTVMSEITGDEVPQI